MAVEIRTSWILAAVAVVASGVVVWRTIEWQDVEWFFTRAPVDQPSGTQVQPETGAETPQRNGQPEESLNAQTGALPERVEIGRDSGETDTPPTTATAASATSRDEADPFEGIPDRLFRSSVTAVVAEASPPRSAGAIQQAQVLDRVAPSYPPTARRARIQGTVEVEAAIAADGSVESVRVLAGHPWLAPAAEEAMKGWRYAPAMRDGINVASVVRVRFTFRLE